jgi:hypothetical protein
MRRVVAGGTAAEPSVHQKRLYAIVDARRLARRAGLVLSRGEPLRAETTAFLGEWAATAPQGPALTRFCLEALQHLWFETDGEVGQADYAALWHEHFGVEPPVSAGGGRVFRNERRMRRRRPYDTPAAWVHGQWFFAHDRLVQIGERLDSLGWTAAA